MKITTKDAQAIEKTIRLRIAMASLTNAVLELHTAYGYKLASKSIHAVIAKLDQDAIEF